MFNKKNIIISVLLAYSSIVEVYAGRSNPAPSTTTIIPVVQPANSPSTFTQDIEDDLSSHFPKGNALLLELLVGGGGAVASTLASVGMVVGQSVLTKKVMESSYFNKPIPDAASFFSINTNKSKEREFFLNSLIKDFEIVRKQKGSDREEKEGELLNKLEKEIAKSKADTYRTHQENLMGQKEKDKKIFSDPDVQLGILDTETKPSTPDVETKPSTPDVETKPSTPDVETKSSTPDVDNNKKFSNDEKKRVDENIMLSRNLEVYYSSASQGKPHNDLLKHPGVKAEVLQSKKEFAERIISTPAIYNNLSKKTRENLHAQAKGAIKEHTTI